MSDNDGPGALGAKCRKCTHIWIVAYIPMRLDFVAQLGKRAMCPKCGDKQPFVARDEEVSTVLAREHA